MTLQYTRGQYRLEDLELVQDLIAQVIQTRGMDIGNFDYKSLREKMQKNTNDKIIANKDEETKMLSQCDIIYTSPLLRVIHPKTEASACYFGRNTEWCTAWGNHRKHGLSYQGKHPTKTNQFKNYTELYIIEFKSGELYQFDFKSKQFMDAKDEEINPRELADKYPILWDIFEPISIRYDDTLVLIKNPSEAVQLAAVKQNGIAIYYINNPSEEMKLAAVKQRGNAIRYVNNPSETVQLAAVKQYGHAIGFINDPSEAVQLAAVQQNGHAIRYIDNPSEAVQLAAVQEEGLAISYINNPSEAVQLAAVQEEGLAISYINNPSEEMKLAAVKQRGDAIRYVNNPSEAVQFAAVQQNRYAIRYIKNPSEAVRLRMNYLQSG